AACCSPWARAADQGGAAGSPGRRVAGPGGAALTAVSVLPPCPAYRYIRGYIARPRRLFHAAPPAPAGPFPAVRRRVGPDRRADRLGLRQPDRRLPGTRPHVPGPSPR